MQTPDPPDPSADPVRNRLYYNREQFDDYWIALMAKLRLNDEADLLISGLSPHPLLSFQRANLAALQLLGFIILSDIQLIEDPFDAYTRFTEYMATALHRHPGPVPAFDLAALDRDYQVHRRAQRYIYSVIVSTLRVGSSMHYARRVRFGAGLHLLNIIRADNRQVTTRSLMALFSALLSLRLKPVETFEAFSRRIDLVIQRLLNWRPPVVLPDQLLLFCALRALPSNPYGPVRHIILASPNVNFNAGMAMLRDVANTGAKVINDTLGSGDRETKPTAILCAEPCPTPPQPTVRPPPRGSRARRTPAGRGRRTRKPRGPSKLCQSEGPCVHHGPHSFHATSECRDPTLSRTKRAQPRETVSSPAESGLAGVAAAIPAPSPEDCMYSPVFVTRISKASCKNDRVSYRPARRHRLNLRRDRRSFQSPVFDVASADIDCVHRCVQTYTRPVSGSFAPFTSAPHEHSRTRSRVAIRPDGCSRRGRARRGRKRGRACRHRRSFRKFHNRRTNYSAGFHVPSRTRREPRVLPLKPAGSFRSRRARRSISGPPSRPRVTPRGGHHVAGFPLPLSVTLLVSCATCGTTTELPWMAPQSSSSFSPGRRHPPGSREPPCGVSVPSEPQSLRGLRKQKQTRPSALTRGSHGCASVPSEQFSKTQSPRGLRKQKQTRSSTLTRDPHGYPPAPSEHAPLHYPFYAVADDRFWGVHEVSLRQVRRWKPELYRGFHSRNNALEWLRAQEPPEPPRYPFYAIADDRFWGVHEVDLQQVRRWKPELYRGFHSRHNALEWLRAQEPPEPSIVSTLLSDQVSPPISADAGPSLPFSSEHPNAPPLETGAPSPPRSSPSSGSRGPHLSYLDLQRASLQALHARPSPGESPEQAHVRIGSTLAAQEQLLELLLHDSLPNEASSFSPCLIVTTLPVDSDSSTVAQPASSASTSPSAAASAVTSPSPATPPSAQLSSSVSPAPIATSSPAAASTSPAHALPRLVTFSERLFDEYTRYANVPGATPPPFVPVCDIDINKIGFDRMQRWLVRQRRTDTSAKSSCESSGTETSPTTGTPVRSASRSSSVRPGPRPRPRSERMVGEYHRFVASRRAQLRAEYQRYADVSGSNPPPFVPRQDYDINKAGYNKMQDWLRQQRRANNSPHPPSDSSESSSRRWIWQYSCEHIPSTSPAPPASASSSTKAISDAHTISDEACINLIASDEDTSPPVVAQPRPPKSKRRFRGHSWSMKGTKQSRRADRSSVSVSSVSSPLVPQSGIPLMPPPLPSKPSVLPSDRVPVKYNAVPPREESTGAALTPRVSCAFKIDHTSVVDVTDHATSSRPHADMFADASTPATTKRVRATYAYATGLHTTLHYPQEFHVALHGKPMVDSSGWYSKPDLFGDDGPSTAISAVVDHVSARPNSLCNHPACIYNLGDAFVRRQRHLLSIRQLDSELGRPFQSSGTVSYERPSPSPNPPVSEASSSQHVLITSSSPAPKTVVDSGASRHIEPDESRLNHVRPCEAVTLQGINGETLVVRRQGRAGNCPNVLLAPSAAASVRSVSAIIDSHNMHVLFTPAGTYLIPPAELPPASHNIALRREDGLFHVVPGSIPPAPASASAFLSVSQQIKREAIHHLHRTLAHASPRRMRQVLTECPEVASSLKPADVRLFTHCDSCGIGRAIRPAAPEKAVVRATSFAYRMHADTSGVVRPSTSSGFTRALVVVDDASRWIFVALLRHADMVSVAAALRSIFRRAAGDESVLRTKYLRTDNGTEFVNKIVDALLAESDIMRELTCVGTSHQNGVAERAIGVVFAVARTMLADACLPPRFWGEAIMCAVYVRNRLPCSSNPNNLSPYEVRYGRRPDLRHLRPFGVRAFVRVHTHITKVQPRADRGIMLGYGESVSSKKGWRIYLPASSRVVTTTAATFHVDLPSSIASRVRSLVSSTPPDFGSGNTAPVASVVEPTDLPVSLRLPAAPAPLPPASASVPAVSLPTPPLRPAIAIDDAPPPVSTGAPSPTRVRVSNLITTPILPLSGDPQLVPTATVRRPRGRPPANSTWDPTAGRYVRSLLAAQLPSFTRIWAMVGDSSPHLQTPVTYLQAVNGPQAAQWRLAIRSELASLRECKTWRVIPRSSLPPGASPIRCKWVFKIKKDQNNNVARFKARLTACGYAQRFGRDFDETFAPVASAASIRVIFALAAVLGLYVSQHDVETAFLYGVLPASQRVYLLVPDGVDLPAGVLLECLKALYGLKQAPRLFNQHLTKAISALGYVQSRSDPCVFFKQRGNYISILAIVVDDILHVASAESIIKEFASQMDRTYRMKHLGVPQFMIGIKIDVSASSICLSQEQYIVQAATKFGQLDCVPTHTPAHPSGCLSSASVGDSRPLDREVHPYMSLVGTLLWATVTRPDIQVAVSRACSHTHDATMAHWRAALRILRYLVTTKSYALTYRRASLPPDVSAYVDAGYGNEHGHRSRRGHVVLLANCLVIWSTRATSMVCQSTSEAEFTAANECVKDILWVRGLLKELGFHQRSASLVREDNQATIAMINNHLVSARNRHFCIRMSWLREQAAAGSVKFVYVASRDNLADVFTKILPQPQFQRFRDMLVSPAPGADPSTAQ